MDGLMRARRGWREEDSVAERRLNDAEIDRMEIRQLGKDNVHHYR